MPSPLDRWIRIWSRLSRRRLRNAVDDELGFHLEMLTQRYESRGMSPDEARRAAETRFGDPRRMRRHAFRAERSRLRTERRAQTMDDLRQDLRFAARQLWKRPGFSALALGMLALGIGANTAIFSVVYTVLLRPLPFPEPDRLVQIWESRVEKGWDQASVAPGNFWDLREMNRGFEALAAFRWTTANLTGGEAPERLSVGRASAGFFGQVLRVRPVLGRTFLPEDDQPGADGRVALLGNAFWRSHFGADSTVVGKELVLDGSSVTVVGVLPAGRPWLDQSELFLPLVRDPGATRTSFELAVIGRLRPGVTPEGGRTDLEAVARRLEEAYPAELEGIGIAIEPSREWMADADTRQALWLLLGAVGFLLMIACVNLANLFLARATGRVRETAIRAAAGASRWRLIRQGLTESLFLSLLGAGMGLALAVWGIDAIALLAPDGVPGLADATINGWILAFTLGAGLLTGVVTGLVPSLQASGEEAAVTLRAGGQSIAGNRTHDRLRGVLVAVEVALSLTLLVGAGLLARSFGGLMDAERGFETENRLLVRVNVPSSLPRDEGLLLLDRLVERVRALPPVESAAAVHIRPLSGSSTGLGFVRPDDPQPEGGIPWASWRMVTPGYFETLGLPILRGRDFTTEAEEFTGEGPIPVIISRRMAELLWPGEDAVGRTVTLWAGQSEDPGVVLGVVEDMLERGIDAGPTLAVYLPYLGLDWAPELVIHTSGEPRAVLPALRGILAELAPDVPLSNIATLEEMVGGSVAERRFLAVLVGLFAGLALLLALAGVYGVQAYRVAQQTPEIGVRIAIGASQGRILGKVVVQAMRPALLGVAAGLAGALVLSRFLETLLFQVAPRDPATYIAAAALLALAALASAWLPARRAARVDPVVAFRTE